MLAAFRVARVGGTYEAAVEAAGPQTPGRDDGVLRMYGLEAGGSGARVVASPELMTVLEAFGDTPARAVNNVLNRVNEGDTCGVCAYTIKVPWFYHCGHMICHECALKYGKSAGGQWSCIYKCAVALGPAQAPLSLRF